MTLSLPKFYSPFMKLSSSGDVSILFSVATIAALRLKPSLLSIIMVNIL